jgi:HD-like signal output (HDOD) protein
MTGRALVADDKVLAQIKKLPPLPLVAQRLAALTQQDTSSANDITQVLSSDQALASKVLKLANSSFYGMSGKVSTISRAVVILGFSAIRNMALGLGLAQAIKQSASEESLADFWSHALYVGAACRTLARASDHSDPEEVFVAGLLHDLGRLILDMVQPGYAQSLVQIPSDQYLQAETELVGLAHTRTGQQAARHWHLPERLGSVMRFHHHPSQWRNDETGLTASVMLGDLIARSLGQSGEGLVAPPDPVELAGALGLSLRQTGTLLAQTCEEVQNTRTFLDIAGIDTTALGQCCQQDPAQPQGEVVWLGNDPERAGWFLGQFSLLGWQPLAMGPFLADAQIHADLAILDPRSLKSAQVQKLVKLMTARKVQLVLAAPAEDQETGLEGVTVLPPAINTSDIMMLDRRRQQP